MDDTQIIELFWARDEAAIRETQNKYGTFCLAVSHRILNDRQDEEECVTDLLLRLWNCIPPERPENFRAYIAKLCRNLSIDRYRKNRRQSEYCLAIEELNAELPDGFDMDEAISARELGQRINSFLLDCGKTERAIFIKRYYDFLPTKQIARDLGVNDQKVRHVLSSLRKRLWDELREEGLV